MSHHLRAAGCALALGFVVTLSGCTMASANSAGARATPVPQQLAVFNGRGSQQTETFYLRPASYTLIWTARSTDLSKTPFTVRVTPVPGKSAERLVSVELPGGSATRGQAALRTAIAGYYVFDVAADADWTLTLTAQ